MSDHMGRLVFVNEDAIPRRTSIICSSKSVRSIMAWYGAYYGGDTYVVSFDGKYLSKDDNGCLVGRLK